MSEQFIFTTNKLHNLDPGIRSRCREIEIVTAPPEILRKKYDIAPDGRDWLLEAAISDVKPKISSDVYVIKVPGS